MENNKVIQLLKSFSTREQQQFNEFLRSGFITCNNKVRTLGRLLCSGMDLEREVIFQKIFPGEKYDDKKLRYLFTDLNDAAESFLAARALLRDEKLKSNILIKELAVRNCAKSYSSAVRQFDEELNSDEVRDADYYYYRYYFEHARLSLELERQNRNMGSNIENVLDNLDRFYLAKKIQLCCEVYNVKNVLSVSYKAFLLDEILSYLSKNRYDDTPAVTIYYQILMTLMESENEEHFKKLRELLLKNERTFSRHELREMYQYVLNYCIKKINTGNLGYQKELFSTYKIIIENGVILLGDYFPQWDFKNIVTISCRLKEFDWVENFIHTNKQKLRPDERDNAFSYNLAYLNYQKGKFSAALNLLQKVEFTDLYYQLDTRVILLKIYFEQQDEEGFEYHVNAFRIFLRRNKLISDYQRTIYLNLIKYTSRLLKAGANRKKSDVMRKEIEGNRMVADLQWLLSKIEELGN